MKKVKNFFSSRQIECEPLIKQESIELKQEKLSEFLKLVAFGEQKEAEAMLKKDQLLAKYSGDVTDCAGREFKQITGFQYAVWAFDFQMWRMIKSYLSDKEISKQLEQININAILNKKGWVLRTEKFVDWPSCSWVPLIKVLDLFVKYYDTWNEAQRNYYWCKKVGGAQLILPAHVVNEYYGRRFYPCPEWGDSETSVSRMVFSKWVYPKQNAFYEDHKFGDKLGKGFAWGKGNLFLCGYPHRYRDEDIHNPYNVKIYHVVVSKNLASIDLVAVKKLLDSRIVQVQGLLNSVRSSVTTTVPISLASSSVFVPMFSNSLADKEQSLCINDRDPLKLVASPHVRI